MKSKIIALTFILLCLLSLTACSNSSKETSPSSSETTSEEIVQMDFEEIKSGDYSSLVDGEWDSLGALVKNYFTKNLEYKKPIGNEKALNISPDIIRDQGEEESNFPIISGKDQTLSADEKVHDIKFSELDDGTLLLSLVDPSTIINRTVTFYPKGSKVTYGNKDYTLQITMGQSETITEEVISFWSSNLGTTFFYVRNPMVFEENRITGLNVYEISQDDFSSAVGTWTSPDGASITITDKIVKGDSSDQVGALLDASPGNDKDTPVITSSVVSEDGCIYSSRGIFTTRTVASAFSPIIFAPKGAKAVENGAIDTSDPGRDRLFDSQGQVAYYRDN